MFYSAILNYHQIPRGVTILLVSTRSCWITNVISRLKDSIMILSYKKGFVFLFFLFTQLISYHIINRNPIAWIMILYIHTF